MGDLLEHPEAREAPVHDDLDRTALLKKAPPELHEPEVAVPKRPVRWIRWMVGAVVLIAAAAAVLVYATSDDGTVEVLDTDGSFQAVETARMMALAPTVGVDTDGSFQAVETGRMAALAPTVGFDLDGSFQAVETARMMALEPTVGFDLDGSFQAVETARMMALEPSS